MGTYRAVEFGEYGEPEVLRVVDRDIVEPGPGQVRVRVRAAGVNPVDWKIRSGLLAAHRPTEFPSVPGGDVAGVVEAVGADVTGYEVGSEVLGAVGNGGYAEVVVTDVATLALKPAEVAWEQAAALPIAANTTYAVFDLLRPVAGETIVIHGAAGGVGTVAVQIAVDLGLRVIATASEANQDYLRDLGAEPTVYGPGLVDRLRTLAPDGVDLGYDVSGHGGSAILVELLGGPSRVATIADYTASDIGVPFVQGVETEKIAGRLTAAATLAAAGKLTIPIAGTFPLAEAPATHHLSQDGHVRGKLIIVP
ncbi:NADP-dependent oxidoreductase [Actinokineospora globicatena]|uniref:Oxidoreductase n=1 Tax=Actinokineospora globicatena TaxID=103729 RepID=A0A9W6V5L7_9PSEU|nr:NADP-dependent oxidoreductase [Actinokineospora globicatena]GLW90500.1 oxidoreductase [Actinokineospora globicatena]